MLARETKSWPAVALIAATLAALSCQFSVVHVMALQGEEDHLRPEPEHLSVTRVYYSAQLYDIMGKWCSPVWNRPRHAEYHTVPAVHW